MPAKTIVLTLDDLRVVGLWTAECAERVLALFEEKAQGDTRPREAIEGIRRFARGGKREHRLRSLAMAALAAAREVKDPAARAAARAACQAAASAYTHPIGSTDQARHILAPAVYAALAREAAESVNASDEEIRWAIQQASPTLREILERFPRQTPGKSRLTIRYQELDAGLRDQREPAG